MGYARVAHPNAAPHPGVTLSSGHVPAAVIATSEIASSAILTEASAASGAPQTPQARDAARLEARALPANTIRSSRSLNATLSARVAKYGIRDGFKIHCPKGRAGSSPAPGT
jgi:hypothetical protein